jgi:cholesterol transport system auxiliary component
MRLILIGLVGLALAGCVSVLPKASPAAARYLIDPVAYDAPAAEQVKWSLIVEDPISTRVYDTTKMALLREPGRVEYYANGEWADRAPRLVQTALIRSYENSGRIMSVGDRVSLPGGTYALQTDIRAMHADYSGGDPVATITIYARLTSGRGHVVAARLFEQKVSAEGDTVPDVGAAFDTAVTAALRDMVDWSIAEAEKAHAEREAARKGG